MWERLCVCVCVCICSNIYLSVVRSLGSKWVQNVQLFKYELNTFHSRAPAYMENSFDLSVTTLTDSSHIGIHIVHLLPFSNNLHGSLLPYLCYISHMNLLL